MLFTELNLKPQIKQALDFYKYLETTPIQEATFADALVNNDILAQAPTGTGKTMAFGIPVVERIDETKKQTQALIVCPTRELAVQVCAEIKKLLKFLPTVKAVAIYGGDSMDKQIRYIKEGAQIIVATPGRLNDHLRRKTIKLDNISMLVFDEADEMLEMGFRDEIDDILKNITREHQTLLFSATIPEDIKRISSKYQKDAKHIKTLGANQTLPKIEQFYIELLEKNKIDCLSRIIDVYNFKQALVFCRTKRSVEELSGELVSRGYTVQSLHGDLRQNTREYVLNQFKKGICRILIATDIAARGIDVEGIDVVLNYDIPDDVEYYTHRIGRTARAGREGRAYSFVNRREVGKVLDFARRLKTNITKIDPPSYSDSINKKAEFFLKNLVEKHQNTEGLDNFKSYVYNFILNEETKIDIDDLCSMLLKQALLGNSQNADSGEDLSVLKNSKKDKKIDGFTRCFINLGKMDDLSKEDLKGLVRTHRHVTFEQIVNIDILSTYSFFEVPNDKVELVLKELNGLTYKNREISCEIAGSRGSSNHKKEGRSHERRRTGKSEGYSSRRREDRKDRPSGDKKRYSSPKPSGDGEKPKRRERIKKQRIDIKW